MKNSKILLILVSMLSLQIGYAQLQKGNLLLGGNVALDFGFNEDIDNSFTIAMTPTILSLVTDNLAIGGSLPLAYSTLGDFSLTSIGVLPAARIYFPIKDMKMAFFVDAQLGLGVFTISDDFSSESETNFAYRFGPGLAFFTSEDVSLDLGLTFARNIAIPPSRSNLQLNLGIQVFLINNKNKQK